jgi:hypothetical protein
MARRSRPVRFPCDAVLTPQRTTRREQMSASNIHKAVSTAAVWLLCVSANACVPAWSNVPALHPRSTILSGSELESSLRSLYHCGAAPSKAPSGAWIPSTSQAVEADRRVRAALARSLSTDHIAEPGDYYIQYLGLIMEGRQVIFANGVHEVAARGYLPSRWHSTPMVICDLGRAGFRTEYDPITRQLGDLRFAEEYRAPSR